MINRESVLKSIVAMIYIFLLMPIIAVVIISFHPTSFPQFPPTGLTLDWYFELFTDDRMLRALLNSFIVSTGSAIFAGLIGTVTALGFARHNFRGESILSSIMLMPMLISPVIIGVAITIYFSTIGIPKNRIYLVLGHSTIILPYVFILVQAQVYGLDESAEEAARTLGANKIETFLEVTFPMIRPGVLAGMLIGFVISFGEFTATQFWVTPGTETAPILIYSMLRTGLTPMINALATMLIISVLIIPLLIQILSR
jgi:ABC-type spermidine/putrescine transport system permease subunit II